MSIESDLKKDGIKVVSQLDTLKVNSIAHSIAGKLCKAFPECNFDEADLFIRLSRLNMYKATMPEGMAEANYFYKNTSIYFNYRIPDEDLEEFAIHECIHYLQEVKDKNHNLVRMGLCVFDKLKISGMGINEAATQYVASKVIGINKDFVKYFGVSFQTTSPSYYPLECNLIEQMASLVGEECLLDSTFHGNDNFKNTFIENSSENDFYQIQYFIDEILEIEEEIIRLNNKSYSYEERNKKVEKLEAKIDKCKSKITDRFVKAQNLIIKSYFDNSFKKITNLEELDNFRKKLEHHKELIGTTDNYTFFDDYYTFKMSELEHKSNVLENGGIETALEIATPSSNKLFSFFRALKNFVTGEKSHN